MINIQLKEENQIRNLLLSRWSNEFENHPIHQTLRQAQEWLSTETGELDVEFEMERFRLEKVLDTLQSILSGLDAEFFPKQIMDQIDQHLRHPNFQQQLQNYSSKPDVGYLRVANDHVTAYTNQIFHLAALARPEDAMDVIKRMEAAYSSFLSSTQDELKQTSSETSKSKEAVSALERKVTETLSLLTEIQSKAEEQLSEWQVEFSESEASRLKQSAVADSERKAKFDELLTTWQQQVIGQSSELLSKNSQQLNTTLQKLSERAETVLKDVNEKHQSVLEIHKLVGRDSVAGGYQRSAGEEQKAANRWRSISMIGLIAAVLWLGFKYSMGFDANAPLNWAEVVTASSLTAILLLTAGYASRQSKMHRDNEKQMRAFALETKALDPFMANLDVEDQKKIKAELIRRMFGQSQNHSSGRTSKLDDSTVNSLVERVSKGVIDTVGRVVDRG